MSLVIRDVTRDRHDTVQEQLEEDDEEAEKETKNFVGIFIVLFDIDC
jgi:hypothetical protein